MKIPFVDLKAQYQSIRTEIDQAIASVIKAGNFIAGDHVKAFEANFSDYVGLEHCITCGNGSDALEMALRACGIGEGDEVIVPAFSWIATADSVNAVGAEPVFVDILKDEFTLDPSLLHAALTDRTKAIIPVHLYGLPARMEEIKRIADEYNLKVIEDCAQAHGAFIGERHVGTFGDAATFSFYPVKNLGAYGDAGAVLTNDKALAKNLRRIGNHGQLSKFDFALLGRNSRMDSMQAAILNAKLQHLSRWVQRKNEIARYYLDTIKGVTFQNRSSKQTHAYHIFAIHVQNRAKVIETLEVAGIGYGIHYPQALPFAQAYAYKGHSKGDFPNSEQASNHLLSLPIYPEISDEMLGAIVEQINISVNTND
jgi:dTDP-4-amino-4,6-dideoxygalactose transaminase